MPALMPNDFLTGGQAAPSAHRAGALQAYDCCEQLQEHLRNSDWSVSRGKFSRCACMHAGSSCQLVEGSRLM